jgi:hypothetical protein
LSLFQNLLFFYSVTTSIQTLIIACDEVLYAFVVDLCPPVYLTTPWLHPSLLHRFLSVCHTKIPSVLETTKKLLCLCILINKYALFCILFANWHSPATLTDVFPCFFFRCKANARVYLAKTGHGPHSSY